MAATSYSPGLGPSISNSKVALVEKLKTLATSKVPVPNSPPGEKVPAEKPVPI